MGSLAIESELKKFIVLWITAVGHDLSDLNHLCVPHQYSEEFKALVLMHIWIETGTAEDIIQFCHRGRRHEQRAVLQCTIERLPWQRLW